MMERIKVTQYMMVTRPDYLEIHCPACNRTVHIPFTDVEFTYPDSFELGGICECPGCNVKLEVEDFYYDII